MQVAFAAAILLSILNFGMDLCVRTCVSEIKDIGEFAVEWTVIKVTRTTTMTDDSDDRDEVPIKYTKAGFRWGAPWRKKPRLGVGTKLPYEVVEAWRVIAQKRGEHLNKVLADLIMAEFNRLMKSAT